MTPVKDIVKYRCSIKIFKINFLKNTRIKKLYSIFFVSRVNILNIKQIFPIIQLTSMEEFINAMSF